MIFECKKREDCWMNIGFPDLILMQTYKGYSETLVRGLSGLSEVKKNRMRMLRHSSSELLRQDRSPYTGFILRGCKDISGSGGSAGILPGMREREDPKKKGHTYRRVVSDLERNRPIWFGGKDRSEESFDEFYRQFGKKKTKKIQLAVMDMWKAFLKSTKKNAPQAAILYDKFHVMRHLGEALDEIRKKEYARLSGKDRSYIKGQKYTLLSNRENLTLEGGKALKKLLAANKRLNAAYLLKESFGQLWSYQTEGWARKFFDNWKQSLKWQRLKAYEKFAEMIERHWDGIAAYSKPENKVSLGFVEGLNNKIRVIQRRAYGIRDEEYLRLKILTCMLKEI